MVRTGAAAGTARARRGLGGHRTEPAAPPRRQTGRRHPALAHRSPAAAPRSARAQRPAQPSGAWLRPRSAGGIPGLRCQWPGEFGPVQAISSPNSPHPFITFTLYFMQPTINQWAKPRAELGSAWVPCSRFSGKPQQRHKLQSKRSVVQNVQFQRPDEQKGSRASGPRLTCGCRFTCPSVAGAPPCLIPGPVPVPGTLLCR